MNKINYDPNDEFKQPISFTVESEPIQYTTYAPQPKKSWEYTDKEGHVHKYNEHGYVDTIEWEVDYEWWCEDCRDMHEEGHWECEQCGEEIDPETIVDTSIQTIPGRSFYYINGIEVSKETFVEIQSKFSYNEESSHSSQN